MTSASALRSIARFTVTAGRSKERQSGQMSIVPPARSMRVGAEARIMGDNMGMRGDTRPLIGLTARTRVVRSGQKERLNEAVPRGYVEGVEGASGLPVI